MGAFSDRNRRSARRPAFRVPKYRFLIVAEGKVTERSYFTAFKKYARNGLVEVEIADESGMPRTIVEIAKEKVREAKKAAKRTGNHELTFDEVWCVFDVDSHPNLANTCKMAKDNQFEVAVSNPNFELWLLLHLQAPPGSQPREKIREMLKAHWPDYDKEVDFERCRGGYDSAVAWAKALDLLAAQVDEPGRNPTTGVYRLTENIRNGSPVELDQSSATCESSGLSSNNSQT